MIYNKVDNIRLILYVTIRMNNFMEVAMQFPDVTVMNIFRTIFG